MNLSGMYKTRPREKADYGGMTRKLNEGKDLTEAERRALCEDMGQKAESNHLYFCKRRDDECPYAVKRMKNIRTRCNVNLLLEGRELGADVVIVQR